MWDWLDAMLVMVVSRGFDIGLVTDLPLVNFSALVERMLKVQAEDELRAAYMARAVAHADGDGFKDFVDRVLMPRVGRERPPTRSPDELGGGF